MLDQRNTPPASHPESTQPLEKNAEYINDASHSIDAALNKLTPENLKLLAHGGAGQELARTIAQLIASQTDTRH